MEYKSEKPSCLECIWRDQCESDEICDFFDPGRLPTDEINTGWIFINMLMNMEMVAMTSKEC